MGRHVTPPPLAVRWIEVDEPRCETLLLRTEDGRVFLGSAVDVAGLVRFFDARGHEVDQRVTHIGAISDPPAPPRRSSRRPRPARRRRARAAA